MHLPEKTSHRPARPFQVRENPMDNFALIRHAAQTADNHTADLEIKRLAQAVIALTRLCEQTAQAVQEAKDALEFSQKSSKRLRA
jgi:hypothetical protein